MKGLFAVAAAVIVAAGIRAAQPVLTPVLLAALISLAAAPLMNVLRKRNVPEPAAISLVLTVVLVGLSGLFVLVGTAISALVERMPRYQQEMQVGVAHLIEWLQVHGVRVSPEILEGAIDPTPLLGLLGRLLQGVANFVSVAFLVLLVVAFMLIESIGLRAKLLRVGLKRTQLEALRHTSRLVDRYLGVKFLSSAVTGLLLGGWTAILGLELSLLWGLLAFVLNFIPTIGSILAALPPMALAVLQLGPWPAVLVASGYLLVNFVIGNGIEPRVMGAALGLSPLVVFFSLFLWGFLLGPVGALLSVPLTIIMRIYFANVPELAFMSVLLGPSEEPDVLSSVPPPPPEDLPEALDEGSN